MRPDPSDGSYSLGNPQSFNRYSYALNTPFSATDPSGRDSENDTGHRPVITKSMSVNRGSIDEIDLLQSFFFDPATFSMGYIAMQRIAASNGTEPRSCFVQRAQNALPGAQYLGPGVFVNGHQQYRFSAPSSEFGSNGLKLF